MRSQQRPKVDLPVTVTVPVPVPGKTARPAPLTTENAGLETRALQALSPQLPAASACAPGAGSTFTEAWVRRVAEVDDGTLQGMMRYLVQLRRIKHALGACAFVGGAAAFGYLPIDNPLYALLIHGTLACCFGVPTLAIGSLAVRRLFLQEAERLGLSRSTSLLLLTRAERRARYMRPFQGQEQAIRVLQEAVRSWDEA